MSSIELFPHNEEAVDAMLEGLEDSNFAFMERATGTGKSMVLIKLMAELMRNKRILFVTLHDAMFQQLVKRDMPSCNLSKDAFEKLDCILYSSIPKHEPEWYYKNYDYFIFDEAQHCGAPKWGNVISKLSDLVKNSPDKKMIGATATRIRFLDDYMDVCKEFFDDNLCSSLGLPESILRELLPAPYYININKAPQELVLRIRNKLHKLRQYSELDAFREEIESYYQKQNNSNNINELLKKYGVKNGEKYIVFCTNIDDLRKKMEDVDNWFQGIGKVTKYTAHSNQKNAINQNQIDAFEKDNDENSIKVMFAVDMFNEGLHINGVDGVLMTRKTASPIVYLQQLGRALSYSARKKQIKVFDLAGNATNIDTIYNLYKELLEIARENIKTGSGNIAHYQEIISRFKIVDEGTQVNDRLLEIERFIDENYFNKEKISKYVSILCNYAETINGNFMDLLKSGQIDEEHIKIYKELQKLQDLIPYNELIRLSSAGILITNIQLNKEILEKIRIKGNLKNIKDEQFNNFMLSYNNFYSNHHRRPNNMEDEAERNMQRQYRSYLSTTPLKKIKRILKNTTYPLNVEELLLLKDFPSREDINTYLDVIESKYLEGIKLDPLEIITIKNIQKTFSLKDRPLIKSMLSKDILLLDKAIQKIDNYKKIHPEERFENKNRFLSEPQLYDAIDYLEKKAEYVTNLQFQKLLSLNIKLPDSIDMTMEERMKKLGRFQSLYEYNEYTAKKMIEEITQFINKNHRRPNKDIPEESTLYYNMKYLCQEGKSAWARKIFKCIEANQLPLTIFEKSKYYSDAMNQDDYKVLLNNIIRDLKEIDERMFNGLELKNNIRLLYKNGIITEKLKDLLIATTTLVQFVLGNNHKEEVSHYLLGRQSLIPYSLKNILEKKFQLKYSILDRKVHYRENNINYAHGEYETKMNQLEEYYQYIQNNGSRPAIYTLLHMNLREYYATSSASDIRLVINKINSLGMPITLYEKYLLGLCHEEEEKKLYEILKQKRLKNKRCDRLDEKLYNKLHSKIEFGIDDSNHKINDTSTKEINIELKSELIAKIKEQIDLDPSKEIEYKENEIGKDDIKKLEEYRIYKYSFVYFNRIINQMKRKEKPAEDILTKEEMETLSYLLTINMKKKDNIELIDDYQRLNRKYTLKKHNLDPAVFLHQYIDYIKTYKEKPTIESKNELGKVLAIKMNQIQAILTKEELQSIEREFKKIITHEEKKQFYEQFIEFIERNERFPSLKGDTEEEKELAKDYQKNGSKLAGEQKKVIDQLRKKYGVNTIMFAKKRG